MNSLEVLMKSLNSSVWELGEAFQGLTDADVWIRPHAHILSIGEISCHLAYWESLTFLGPDAKVSPIAASAAQYFTSNRDTPFHMEWGADELITEIRRIHELCKASLILLKPKGEDPNPYRPDWSWASAIEYQSFHFAYHTGQIYTIRHLMGHETVDN